MRKITILSFVSAVYLLSVCSIGICETIEGYFVDQKSYTGIAGSFGEITGDVFAQSFVPTFDHVAAVSKIAFYQNYSDAVVEIRPDNGGYPSDTILGTSSTSASLPPFNETGIVFDPPVYVTPGDTYYIVFYEKSDATQVMKPGSPQNYDYPNGQPYYKEGAGNWITGLPPEFYQPPGGCYDYSFEEYFLGEDTVPIAEANHNMVAAANETITLDGSHSYDPDGTIVKYEWRRLPDNTVLYSGSEPTYEIAALGRASEIIQLTVTDEYGATSTDTVEIINQRLRRLRNKIVSLEERVSILEGN